MSTFQAPVRLEDVQEAPTRHYSIAVNRHLGSNIILMMGILQFCVYFYCFEDMAALALGPEHSVEGCWLPAIYQNLGKECRDLMH